MDIIGGFYDKMQESMSKAREDHAKFSKAMDQKDANQVLMQIKGMQQQDQQIHAQIQSLAPDDPVRVQLMMASDQLNRHIEKTLISGLKQMPTQQKSFVQGLKDFYQRMIKQTDSDGRPAGLKEYFSKMLDAIKKREKEIAKNGEG